LDYFIIKRKIFYTKTPKKTRFLVANLQKTCYKCYSLDYQWVSLFKNLSLKRCERCGAMVVWGVTL